MKVSVLVCTYGSREWKLRGSTAALNIPPGFQEVIALHEPNATLADVRNLAASAATGDWLCFVDADDTLDADYLEAMDEAAEAAVQAYIEFGHPSLLVPAVSYVRGDECSEPTIPAWDRCIFDVNCAVIGTLVPRSLFAKVGGFHEWSVYEDWELWLRCIAAGAKLIPVRDAVYCARAQDGTGRNTNPDHPREYERIRIEHAAVPMATWWAAKT